MNISVAHTDAQGHVHDYVYSISFPRFVKHFVLAGSGFTPTATLLARGLGAVAWYWDFVRPAATGGHRFGEPAPVLRDPTLKGHFSNLAGRAFADYLGRRIAGCWVTLSYEGALLHFGHQLVGKRPDLLAVRPGFVLALEAKGYAKRSVSFEEMSLHKEQARQGPLLRHAWAASVAFNLYNSVKIKYHDPEDERPAPDPRATRDQIERYAGEAMMAADQLSTRTRNIGDREFLAVPLQQAVRGRVPLDVDASGILNRIELLIARDIKERTRDRIDEADSVVGSKKAGDASVEDSNLFIDSDGIGVFIAD